MGNLCWNTAFYITTYITAVREIVFFLVLVLDLIVAGLAVSYSYCQLKLYEEKHTKIVCPRLILGEDIACLLEQKLFKLKLNTLIVCLYFIFAAASFLILIYIEHSLVKLVFHLCSHINIVLVFTGFMINSLSTRLQHQYSSNNIIFRETSLAVTSCQLSSRTLNSNYETQSRIMLDESSSDYYLILNPWNGIITSTKSISIGVLQ